MVQRERKLMKRILEQKRRTDRVIEKLSPDYPGDSPGTQKKALPKSGKAHELRLLLVVPTGLFPVKTGIYMPNNFNGLDRRPFNT